MLLQNINWFLSRLQPPPEEWENETGEAPKEGSDKKKLDPLPCTSWVELTDAWKQAMEWTDDLDVTLSVMLAVACSTKLQLDQVWLRLIGIPGTAKSTLCEAISVSEWTHPMSVLTGLHSGYKGEGAGDDSSLIPKINTRTAIINEGDMLLKAPNRDQIMAELRDLYTGVARCHYRNGKQITYGGIRTTVILAGTPTLRVLNKSALGDRFLDCIVYTKESEAGERSLVRKVLNKNRKRMIVESNGEAISQDAPERIIAFQKTGGYLNYLRENLGKLIGPVEETLSDEDEENCESMGKLVAQMRTRPHGGEEDKTEPELHIRLSNQLLKLALCLPVVLNKRVEPETMRRVAKVANDTCYGNTYQVINALREKSLDNKGLEIACRTSQDATRKATGILNLIGCIKPDTSAAPSGALNRTKNVWRLSPQTKTLLDKLNSLLYL